MWVFIYVPVDFLGGGWGGHSLNFIHAPVVCDSDPDADNDSMLALFFKISSCYWG